METTTSESKELFQLVPMNNTVKVLGGALGVGRYLIGRSESCDLIILSNIISSVHAVLEVTKSEIKIYDMNSRNGTFVNNNKIVTKDIALGDVVSFGNIEFKVRKYQNSTELPPALDVLDPMIGEASLLKNTKRNIETQVSTELPKPPTEEDLDIPYIVYPLSSDPKSDYSEYIFEDKDDLYPIFKYELNKRSVEIIILYKDLVYSVDYLPEKNGVFHMAGLKNKTNEVEFPYLGKTEKVPFVEIKNGNVVVSNLHQYELLLLSDNEVKNSKEGRISIQENDIVKISNGDLEIYVRKVSSPPKVKAAPFFRRDKELRKYFLLVLLFILLPLVSLQFIKVEKVENPPDPERVATILYKQKLLVNLNKSDAKTEKKNEKKIQKIKEEKKVLQKKQDQKKANPLKSTKSDKIVNKDPGSKTAPTKQVVKKVDKPLPKKATQAKTKTAKAATPTKNNNSRRLRYAPVNQKTVGKVDVYKSLNFKSSISSLMAKGGSLSGATTAQSVSSNSLSDASIAGGVESLENAKVNGEVGSLTGATVGKIGTSKGAGGLSTKTGVYTAGIPSETVVLGSMDPDVIRRILRENIPQFRSCYQRELNRSGNSSISGTIRLLFTIAASGSVSRAGVDGQTKLPPTVKGCVINVLRGIQFPSPLGGGTVDVKQPFNFSPQRL